jgi:hypothetical protein
MRKSFSARVRVCWTVVADAIGANRTRPDTARRVQISSQPLMASTRVTLPVLVEQHLSVLEHAWKWLQDLSNTEQRNRKLRVCESVQLGDKKFVALIQADGQRFLQ